MNQFFLQQGYSKELQSFPHIAEFAFRRNSSIRLNSFPEKVAEGISFYYIMEGRFEWIIRDQHHILYPSDLAIILPGQSIGAVKGHLDIGALAWLYLKTDRQDFESKKLIGKWSTIAESEIITIKKLLLLNSTPVIPKVKDAGSVFLQIHNELFTRELGYTSRVNHLIDELFILITRQLTRRHNSHRDFPQTFLKLEETLRKNLSHQWTIEEMATQVGLGTTAFNEKVKSFTGFSPLNYLINIRISEAIKLLKRQDVNITDIALETGFYSSQHFSTTFRKLTGYTPSQFRKNIISKS